MKTFCAFACLALAGVAAVPRGANAAILPSPSAAMFGAPDHVANISFWARPFPSGYRGWSRCPRVRVETPYGWYWDRVCSEPGVTILRRAY
jgi:hypothetical protein